MDELATEAHRRLVVAMADGTICPVEFDGILRVTTALLDATAPLADRTAKFDVVVQRATVALHNGLDSPRLHRLEAQLDAQAEGIAS